MQAHEHRPATAYAVASLDGNTKKRTSPEPADIEAINALLADAAEPREPSEPDTGPAYWDEAPAGRYVRLSCENWRAIEIHPESGARYTPIDPVKAPRTAVVITQLQSKPEPPRQHGDRWTDSLTHAAQVKIENATKYAHRMGWGFRTFCTLTLAPEWRERLRQFDFQGREDICSEVGPIDPAMRGNLGRWVADFIRALKLAYARGQVLRQPITSDVGPQQPKVIGRLRSHSGPLAFCWVAENPLNDAGDSNPHVHLMMNWGVAPKHFRAWAAWLEELWGKGFANLTRLKKPESAAGYMAKAAKYIAKGTDGSQGSIRGNRYGIAACCRPPRPRGLGVYYADFIHEAVKVLHESRDLPRGLWASRYAFGTTSRAQWHRVWRALKADGFHFDPAPPDLGAVRFQNVELYRADQARRWAMEQAAWQHAYTDENWKTLLHDPLEPMEDVKIWH